MSDNQKPQDWDSLRTQATAELDAVLDMCGNQTVPPSFHTPLAADGDEPLFRPPDSPPPTRPPSATNERAWKTLRDFIDERALEDAAEMVDAQRNELDVCRTFLPLHTE